MTQTPTPSLTSPSNPIGTILGSVAHGMWLAATSSPSAGVVFCFAHPVGAASHLSRDQMGTDSCCRTRPFTSIQGC